MRCAACDIMIIDFSMSLEVTVHIDLTYFFSQSLNKRSSWHVILSISLGWTSSLVFSIFIVVFQPQKEASYLCDKVSTCYSMKNCCQCQYLLSAKMKTVSYASAWKYRTYMGVIWHQENLRMEAIAPRGMYKFPLNCNTLISENFELRKNGLELVKGLPSYWDLQTTYL